MCSEPLYWPTVRQNHLIATTQHRERVSHSLLIASPEKDQNSEFEVRFLVNTHHFRTIVKPKSPSRTIVSQRLSVYWWVHSRCCGMNKPKENMVSYPMVSLSEERLPDIKNILHYVFWYFLNSKAVMQKGAPSTIHYVQVYTDTHSQHATYLLPKDTQIPNS